jgi:hypothetical protein
MLIAVMLNVFQPSVAAKFERENLFGEKFFETMIFTLRVNGCKHCGIKGASFKEII